MEELVFNTRVVKIWKREDGIAVQQYHKDAQIELADMKEIIDIGYKYFNQENLIFVDASGIKEISYEARKILLTKEGSANVKAMAIKVKSKTSTFIANFFYYVNKPEYPTKLFTNEEKAIEWLKSFNL